MNKKRCEWLKLTEPIYVDYHDNEWGKPLYDDKELFELFSLETQAAGLSWLSVLKKRDGYREVFANFDIDKIIQYSDVDIDKIMEIGNVIRNRKKLFAIVNNAKLIKNIITTHGSFSKFLWSYVDNKPIVNSVKNYKEAPTTSEISDKLTKDMKQMGFAFIGSVTLYAFMQACGMIDDHEDHCAFK